MTQAKKKYDIGGFSKTRQQVTVLPTARIITSATKLVSIETASRLLQEERGLEISAWTIARRCSTGKWQEGVFWVRPMRQYLINIEAVYEAIASGDAL